MAVNSGSACICGRLLMTSGCHLACMESPRQDSALSVSELHSLPQPCHTPGWSTEQTSWTQSGNRKLEGTFTLKKEFSLFLLGCLPPPPLPFCCYNPFEAAPCRLEGNFIVTFSYFFLQFLFSYSLYVLHNNSLGFMFPNTSEGPCGDFWKWYVRCKRFLDLDLQTVLIKRWSDKEPVFWVISSHRRAYKKPTGSYVQWKLLISGWYSHPNCSTPFHVLRGKQLNESYSDSGKMEKIPYKKADQGRCWLF